MHWGLVQSMAEGRGWDKKKYPCKVIGVAGNGDKERGCPDSKVWVFAL